VTPCNIVAWSVWAGRAAVNQVITRCLPASCAHWCVRDVTANSRIVPNSELHYDLWRCYDAGQCFPRSDSAAATVECRCTPFAGRMSLKVNKRPRSVFVLPCCCLRLSNVLGVAVCIRSSTGYHAAELIIQRLFERRLCVCPSVHQGVGHHNRWTEVDMHLHVEIVRHIDQRWSPRPT